MVFIKRRSSFKLIILLSLLIFFSLISLSFGQIDVSFNHILNIIMYNLGLSSIDSNWFTQEELAIISLAAAHYWDFGWCGSRYSWGNNARDFW